MPKKINTIFYGITLLVLPTLALSNPTDQPLEKDKWFQIGLEYYYKKEFRKAKEAYTKASEFGSTEAQYELISLYSSNQEVSRDYFTPDRVNQYTKSAQNNSLGQYNLGYLYQHGLGVQQDYAKARKHYENAALQNFPEAQNNLAYLYEHGLGGPKDYEKAREYYEKSALQNVRAGQFNLATLYRKGLGGPKDYAKAREYYEKSALQNTPEAQLFLGGFYEHGLGGPKNLTEAVKWYQKAAAQGQEDARVALKRLNIHSKNGVHIVTESKGMPPEQLEKMVSSCFTAASAKKALFHERQSKLKQLKKAEQEGNQAEEEKLKAELEIFPKEEECSVCLDCYLDKGKFVSPQCQRIRALKIDEAKKTWRNANWFSNYFSSYLNIFFGGSQSNQPEVPPQKEIVPHFFCETCALELFKTPEADQCPLCREAECSKYLSEITIEPVKEEERTEPKSITDIRRKKTLSLESEENKEGENHSSHPTSSGAQSGQ